MKVDKFPKRIQSLIQEFESLPNQKRYRYLFKFKKRTLIISRVLFDCNKNIAVIKYVANSKTEYPLNEKFIEEVQDISIEKVNVIRKKLKLKSVHHRKVKVDEEGNIIKKERINKELSELEFKALFDERFITDEIRDDFFTKKDLMGHSEFPKRNFKTIKPEFQEVVDEFLEKYVDLNTINEHYKRNNYGTLSLIVGKTFTNKLQQDPRFKVYKSIAIIHRQNDPYVKVVVNNVKGGKDTIYYLINENTLLKIDTWNRYRNRG